MKTITATELRQRWSETLVAVNAGEVVVVTRRGVPVARLDPTGSSVEVPLTDALNAMDAIRRRASLGADVTVRDLIDEGRRF